MVLRKLLACEAKNLIIGDLGEKKGWSRGPSFFCGEERSQTTSLTCSSASLVLYIHLYMPVADHHVATTSRMGGRKNDRRSSPAVDALLTF